MAEADGNFIQMQQADAKENADTDVVVQPGDADFTADVQADSFVDDL